MKVCNQCKEPKTLSLYTKDPRVKVGRLGICKVCVALNAKERSRTKVGLIRTIAATQRTTSKRRGHQPPTYSTDWLVGKLLGDTLFLHLYEEWVASDYQSKLRPSIDRKRDDLPYTRGNIQLMTWEENNLKGVNNTRKKVYQFTLEGILIREFASATEAAKILGIGSSHIGTCAEWNTNRTQAGGFKWSFTETLKYKKS